MVICELREKYSLKMLLEIAGLARSTFNYVKKHIGDKERRDAAILKEIENIFQSNNGKYG